VQTVQDWDEFTVRMKRVSEWGEKSLSCRLAGIGEEAASQRPVT